MNNSACLTIDKNNNFKNRISLCDNIKFLLILLVVFQMN